MGVLRFLARRLLFGALVLLVISLAVFVLFFVVAPGDPAANFVGKNPTPQQIEQARVRYGLDQPVPVQYVTYVGRLAHGDLGYSFRNAEPVRDTLLSRLPATASLAVGGAVVWLGLGIPIGVLAATRPRSLRDRGATVFALAGLSTPTFVLGLVLLYVAFYRLSLAGVTVFPGGGYVPLTTDPLGWAQHLLLPWLTIALTYAASYSRVTRGSLLEVLGEDYIRTARAKGLSERRIVYRHGLRAAITPVVTLLGIDLGSLLGGAIVTEAVFGLQGIGQTAVVAVTNGDLPVIFGTVLLAAFFVVIGNLLVDLAYAVVDVRVRLR
jgi:peptide/nickel transport system permease protein